MARRRHCHCRHDITFGYIGSITPVVWYGGSGTGRRRLERRYYCCRHATLLLPYVTNAGLLAVNYDIRHCHCHITLRDGVTTIYGDYEWTASVGHIVYYYWRHCYNQHYYYYHCLVYYYWCHYYTLAIGWPLVVCHYYSHCYYTLLRHDAIVTPPLLLLLLFALASFTLLVTINYATPQNQRSATLVGNTWQWLRSYWRLMVLIAVTLRHEIRRHTLYCLLSLIVNAIVIGHMFTIIAIVGWLPWFFITLHCHH